MLWVDDVVDVGILLIKFLLSSIARVTLAFIHLFNILLYNILLRYIILLHVLVPLLRRHKWWLIQRVKLRCRRVVVILFQFIITRLRHILHIFLLDHLLSTCLIEIDLAINLSLCHFFVGGMSNNFLLCNRMWS